MSFPSSLMTTVVMPLSVEPMACGVLGGRWPVVSSSSSLGDMVLCRLKFMNSIHPVGEKKWLFFGCVVMSEVVLWYIHKKD